MSGRPAKPVGLSWSASQATPWLLGRVRVRERARDASPAPVADLPLLLVLARVLSRPPVGTVAPVDDDGHVRVVLVVLDHLVVQLVGELTGDHAKDHLI